MENRFLEAMQFRHACKVFDGQKKISDKDFEYILETGRLSPSSFGFEPWKFLVIQNSDLREKIQEFSWGAQKQIPTCSHYLIVLARTQNSMIYNSTYISHMMKDVQKLPENIVQMKSEFYKNFQTNDFELLQNERATFDWASKQTYIAMGNMMSAAAYIGIDSCAIEGFDMKKASQFLQEELKIDTKEFDISYMVAFGYRKEDPRGKIRQDMDDLVQWFN